MSVEIVVPWRAGCSHRQCALEHVLSRYRWSVTVAWGPDPWCKAAAAMPAIAASTADVIVLADADVWCDDLAAAAVAVEEGAAWAIPHKTVSRLAEEATAAVIAGADWEGQELVQSPYRGVEGGGYVVATRETLLEVPLDPRFVGWGQEDVSHAIALRTLAGAPWRGKAPLIHFYHPPQERWTRRKGSAASWALYKRYRAARDNPTKMRALIEEVTDDRNAAQPALHDRPPLRVG